MIKIYGRNVIKEAVRANHRIIELNLLPVVKKKDYEFFRLCEERRINIVILEKQEFDKKYPGLNQGYGALAEDYRYYNLEEVIDKTKRQNFILLDNLEDPANLGAIIRTAEAAAIDAIVIPKNHSVNLNETVAKVSAGALEYVKVILVNNLNRAVMELKQNGFWIIGTDMNAAKTIYEIDNSVSLGVIIGNEGSGIRRLTKELCDYVVKIPMYGKINSLNASVSCGILMYEMIRKK